MAGATPASLWMGGVICHLTTILESPVKQKTENCVSIDTPKFEDSGRVPETCVNLIFGARSGGSPTHKGFPSMVTNEAEYLSPHLRPSTCGFSHSTETGFKPLADVRLKDWDFCFRVLGSVVCCTFLPCFFSETSEPIGFSWKADAEFHWRDIPKEKFFLSRYS